jgi:hypothetical protein
MKELISGFLIGFLGAFVLAAYLVDEHTIPANRSVWIKECTSIVQHTINTQNKSLKVRND